MKILNIPNLLSLSRILAVPVFILLMLEPSPARALSAGIVFSLASATDWLDGYLARKWGQVTKAGKLLDPIADKILIMSALVILVELRSDVVHSWIAIVIIGREFAVTGLRAIASSDGIIIPAETAGEIQGRRSDHGGCLPPARLLPYQRLVAGCRRRRTLVRNDIGRLFSIHVF